MHQCFTAVILHGMWSVLAPPLERSLNNFEAIRQRSPKKIYIAMWQQFYQMCVSGEHLEYSSWSTRAFKSSSKDTFAGGGLLLEACCVSRASRCIPAAVRVRAHARQRPALHDEVLVPDGRAREIRLKGLPHPRAVAVLCRE